jgi:hypothetical protein
MGFGDKSSRGWVPTDKKVGQDAEEKCSGLDWGKFYYFAISTENLKNNTKSYWFFIAGPRVDIGADSSKNNNRDYSTIIYGSQFW